MIDRCLLDDTSFLTEENDYIYAVADINPTQLSRQEGPRNLGTTHKL